MSLRRQLSWAWQRFVLRRAFLLAEGLPLGIRLRVPARDDVGRRLFKYGVHEAPVLAWLQALPAPPEDALSLDVGANLGWYSVVLDRLTAGRLPVHAFEPDPDNRALLRDNLSRNDALSVTVSPLALADAPGDARLNRYRAINLGKHSLLPLDGAVDSVPVRTQSLDAHLENAGLGERPLWFVKLDVEGAEPAVVRGAESALGRINALLLEYSPELYREGEGTAMLEALTESGLRPSLFDGADWVPCTVAELAALDHQRDTAWRRS